MARKPASGSEELLHLQMMEFQCFLKGLPNEYCRERQFVSQLGALAVGESLRANSLWVKIIVISALCGKLWAIDYPHARFVLAQQLSTAPRFLGQVSFGQFLKIS